MTFRVFVVSLALASFGSAAMASTSSAAVFCSVDGSGGRLTVSGEGPGTPWLVRDGEAVKVRSAVRRKVVDVACTGPAATVNTLDAIDITAGDDGAIVDLAGGPFAPGATPEPDAPEIEISTSELSEVTVQGSGGPDAFRSREDSEERASVELNAGQDTDPDLMLSSPLYQPSAMLFGRGGNDSIVFVKGSINGGFGGAGDDVISASARAISFFDGGRGADRLIGGNGPDIMRAGPGRDLLIGRKGDDGLEAERGGRDRIRCGPGKDLYGDDRRDRRKGCERDFDTVELPKRPKLPV